MTERELKRRLMYAMEIYGESLTYRGYTVSRDEYGLTVTDHALRRVYHFRWAKYQRQIDGVLALILSGDGAHASRMEKLPLTWEVAS